VREDAWLANVLERPVFVVDDVDSVPPDLAPGFYYAKVPVDQVERVGKLSAAGFTVVGVQVTLARTLADARSPTSTVVVEHARPEHAEALLNIAASCFRYSRFHLDPELSEQEADRLKREWVRSYAEARRGLGLLAALDEHGLPVGFLCVLQVGEARAIDLIGVAPHAQRRGVGTALVDAFVRLYGADGAELRVGTQIANLPSLALYQQLGFTIVSAVYVLHRHSAPR
jgi:ribosomal protein S18 acetylase RimI-like enzyme